MNKKEFNKFTRAQIKRTAQNVWPMVSRRNTLQRKIAEMQAEIEELNVTIDANETAIKNLTGYTTEDLMVRTVVETDKVDKKGRPIKVTKYELKYPDTIVPPVEIEHDGEHHLMDDITGEEIAPKNEENTIIDNI